MYRACSLIASIVTVTVLHKYTKITVYCVPVNTADGVDVEGPWP